jgi:uncharacterized protein (TIGR00290 family)
MTEKIIFTWSGGKDSAMALYELQKTGKYQISVLLTTVTEGYDRISMHGVRQILLEQQAQSLAISLEKVLISKVSSNEEYEAKMREVLIKYRDGGVLSVAFGDIFLDDLKKYREDKLSLVGMKGIFPLWKRNTTNLAQTFINLGFKTVITCVDSKVLDKKFCGRDYDDEFLADLPDGIDPCGENGEFHSFVYDGPIFKEKIIFTKGDIVLRDNRFYFCDLIPA